MNRRIHLIVEDETDAHIVQAFLKALNLSITIKERTASKGGLSRLVNELERLIQLSKAERRAGDCIAVLHDFDEQSEPNRSLYNRIRDICDKHKSDVRLVHAREEIESWLLADEGICKWLELKAENRDGVRKPSDYFASELNRRFRQDYSGVMRAKINAKISGKCHSESFRKALKYLEDAGCAGDN